MKNKNENMQCKNEIELNQESLKKSDTADYPEEFINNDDKFESLLGDYNDSIKKRSSLKKLRPLFCLPFIS